MEDLSRTIQKIQDGDHSEFAIIYDHFVQKIYSFIFYKVMQKEVAEDLTSEVFLSTLEKIHSFSTQKGALSTWLFTIARNKVHDYWRTNRIQENIEDVWDLFAADDIVQEIMSSQAHRELHQELQNLKAEEREILMLRYWQDYSFAEIAEIQGKTEAAIKMSVQRSIKKLRAKFLVFLLISFFF